MCLKFLLESNPVNQKLVSSLEAREVVSGPTGDDAMNRMGVNVRVGEDGKVKVSSNGTAPQARPSRPQDRAAATSSSLEDEAAAHQKLEKLDLSDDGGGSGEQADPQNHGEDDFM